MTTGIGDFGIATEFRDVVIRIVQDELSKKIAFKYGRVDSISADMKTVMVVFPEAPTTPVKVRVMDTLPREINQIVQVQVDNGLYTLIAVMGPAASTDYTGTGLGQVVGLVLMSVDAKIRATWTPISRASSYEVQFARDSAFSVGLLSVETPNTTYIEAFTPAYTYYVRVRALSSSGATPGPWSVIEHIVCAPYEGAGGAYGDIIGDGNPPVNSPQAVVVAGIGYLYVSWEAQANVDPVTYDVHIGLTTGFTPTPETLVVSTPATFAFIRTLADGITPLTYGVNYFIRIVARDIDGSGPAGPQGYAAPLQVNTGDAGQIASPHVVSDGQLPPAASGLVVDNGMGFLLARWTMVTNPDPVRYEVHISSTNNFVPTSNTLVLTTPSSFAVIKNVGPGAGGGSLVYGVTYYVKIVARDNDGAAAASTQAAGNTVQVNTADIASIAVTSALLADNAVTGSKIAANSVTATKIAAGSIVTSQMVVGGLSDNLVANGSFEEADPATPTRPDSWSYAWWNGNGGTFTRTSDMAGILGGGYAAKISLATATDGQRVSCRQFQVQPGDTFYITVKMRTSRAVATIPALEMHFCSANLQNDVYAIGPATWQTLFSWPGTTNITTYEGQVTVPGGQYWGGIMLSAQPSGDGSGYDGYFDEVIVKKVVLSAVIGQGAITTPKIQVGAITAASGIIADAAIGTAKIVDAAITEAKIADLQVSSAKIQNLAVVDAQIASVAAAKITVGNLLADITVAARIKTADTGARVELNSTGLRAYNSGNSQTVAINSSDGSIIITGASISGGLVEGATVRSRPSGAYEGFAELGPLGVAGNIIPGALKFYENGAWRSQIWGNTSYVYLEIPNTHVLYIANNGWGAAVGNGGGRFEWWQYEYVYFGVPIGIGGRVVTELYCDGWYRTNGWTGWYCQAGGGGVYMDEGSYVKVYGNKTLWSLYMQCDGVFTHWGGANTFRVGNLAGGASWDVTQSSDGMTFQRAASARRKKKDIVPLDISVDELYAIEPVWYYWRQDLPEEVYDPEAKVHAGFIADQIEEHFPEAILYGMQSELIEDYETRALLSASYLLIRDLNERVKVLENASA